MRPLRLAPVLLALLVAGCASPAPPADDAPVEARVAEHGFVLTAALERAATTPGREVLATFHLENAGAPATFTTGGCGPEPFAFSIVAPNGTRIGPLDPDPRCVGPPMREMTLETGGELPHALSWNATRKWRDADLVLHAEPVEPGEYRIVATATLARDGAPVETSVTLRLRVE